MGRATSNYGGEISRTATGDGPLPRIGFPAAAVPQPAMLMTVVIRVPAYGGPAIGAFCPSGFIKSCTKPMIATGLVGAAPLLSNTGTVTSESLTITSCGGQARNRIVDYPRGTRTASPAARSWGRPYRPRWPLNGSDNSPPPPFLYLEWGRRRCRYSPCCCKRSASGCSPQRCTDTVWASVSGYTWAAPRSEEGMTSEDHRDNISRALARVVPRCSPPGQAVLSRVAAFGLGDSHPRSAVGCVMAPVAGSKMVVAPRTGVHVRQQPRFHAHGRDRGRRPIQSICARRIVSLRRSRRSHRDLHASPDAREECGHIGSLHRDSDSAGWSKCGVPSLKLTRFPPPRALRCPSDQVSAANWFCAADLLCDRPGKVLRSRREPAGGPRSSLSWQARARPPGPRRRPRVALRCARCRASPRRSTVRPSLRSQTA